MATKAGTRSRIVSAAWKLFYEQGYEHTTVDEIIAASRTSKGSFYHYFEGKDALLGSLSTLFDEKYEALAETMDPEMSSFDKLIFLNGELFGMIEESVSLDLLAQLYSSQLVTRGERHLMNHNRFYFKLLRRIVTEGQAEGELRRDIPAGEIVRLYAMAERALLYDWCLRAGEFSLRAYGAKIMPMFLSGVRA